jgi:hypothetical protein
VAVRCLRGRRLDVKADLDYRKAYTLRFVNKKVGMDLRRN